ncbi:hypothetical protein [Polyangium spumosum]|uniref:PE-PGRS family protein n=1 Tax=Polyangium spumosum TaxID=889282 RepID=A0A6N7PGJ5_9BACT|nr:hypothetical protein [Polyangium spumosum]MRG91232.1 hypothetical protein [Polyangium spumosum]
MERASLRSFGLASLFVLGTAMAACGTDTTGLFASGGQGSGASGGAGPGGGGQGGAGQGGAGQGGAGNNGGAGQGGAGNNGGAGQGGAGPSSSSASSSSASSSSAQSSSSGMMPPPVMVACGAVTCPVENEGACCWHDAQSQGECVNGPENNDGCNTSSSGRETRIECQLPQDCPAGTVCCADLNQSQGGNWYSLTRCADTCTYGPQRVVCDPQAPDSDCPVVQTQNGPVQTNCEPSTILPDGYQICRL